MKDARLLTLFSITVAIALWLVAIKAPGEEGQGSVSVGNPNDGKLLRGARLPDRGVGFYSNPHSPNKEAKYGTDEMIQAIIKVGADVERRAPGAKLFINDIGFQEGGRISHHQSHQAGRDVDFLFYMYDGAGRVARPKGVHFGRDGKGIWNGGTRDDPSDDMPVTFDTGRNWLVVRSLLENPDAHVQRIFVSEGIRTLLLEHARRAKHPGWLIERAGELMCEPRVPHDDHFHVRLFCTADDYGQGCRDTWPLYPWRRTELAATGLLDPQLRVARTLTKRQRRRRRPPRRRTPGRLWCP